VWLGLTMPYSGRDRRRLAKLAALAGHPQNIKTGDQPHAPGNPVPLLATNDALYATPRQRPLHDVVTCIRLGLRLEDAGTRIAANAERHL
ncbi:hypothetical protein O4H25_14115, partial [Staphylococcus equorum]|nr:hypothetical protein [Staphylococcus equorum]